MINTPSPKLLRATAALTLFAFSFAIISHETRPVKAAVTNTVIYDDALAAGWQNWSWGATVDFGNTSSVFAGSKAIAFTPQGWGGLYVHTDTPIDLNAYTSIHFALRSAVDNEKFSIILYDAANNPIGSPLPLTDFGPSSAAVSYKEYDIPISKINGSHTIKGLALQEVMGAAAKTTYIDSISLQKITTDSIPSSSESAVYSDGLEKGWSNWSWGGSVSLHDSTSVYGGSTAISFSASNPWAGLYLHANQALKIDGGTSLQFALKGTNSGQSYKIALYGSNGTPITEFKNLNGVGGSPTTEWKQYSIPIGMLNPNNAFISGIVLQEAKGISQPAVYIDEIIFGVSESVTPTPTPNNPIPSPTPTPPSQTPTPTTGSGYSTSNNTIYQNGQTIRLKGVSWFGFETGTNVAHGLWARNYKDMIAQMKSLGFNAVRVPFAPAVIRGTATTSIDYAKNSDLQGKNSLEVLDAIMGELNRQQMYILLDHHSIEGQVISELWYSGSYSEQQWITDLQFLANRYKNTPYFMGIDLKNEPHGKATWGTGNSATDWNKAAERAGKAVLSTNPNLLIFVQGIQENPTCSGNIGHWMGGNLEPQKCAPIDTGSIPASKLVFSPHVYGPDVYNQGYFSDGSFPANLPAIWDAHFGFLVSSGMTVVPGEWGGKYGNGGDPKDKVWQDAFVTYMKNKGIHNSFYWDWNPNSGDTGGILQDDWSTPWSNKVTMLQNCFN